MFDENHILRTTLILTLVLSSCALFWKIPVALGLLLGGLMSFLTFRLMIIDATRLLQNAAKNPVDEKSAYHYSFKSFLKRYILYSLALIVGLLNPSLSFMATFAGLLVPRLAIYYHMLSGRIKRGT